MRLAIDAMGGDFAPKPIVLGSIQALQDDPELNLYLVGDEAQIKPLLEPYSNLAPRIQVVHTTEVVDMHDSPAQALRTKKNSTILLCWGLLAQQKVDGLISAGNTGAVVAGGLASRKFLKNIQRPGIAVTMPTQKAGR